MAQKLQKPIVAVFRDGQEMTGVGAVSNKFTSKRNLPTNMLCFVPPWNPNRAMLNVPLAIVKESVIELKLSPDFNLLPANLAALLNDSMVLLTSQSPSDSGYSVLMSATFGSPPEGRTGILLYKNEPVTVTVNKQQFLIEIKGVGSPDGINDRTEAAIRSTYFGSGAERFGSLSWSEGEREFLNLESVREAGLPTFNEGNAVRAAVIVRYSNNVEYGYPSEREDQAYLIRLTPSNIRYSYRDNLAIPSKMDEFALMADIASQYAELAKSPRTLLHHNLHSENFVLASNKYVITDFADVSALSEIDDPKKFLKATLYQVTYNYGISEAGLEHFYTCLCRNLGVSWAPGSGYDAVVEAVFADFIAPRTFDLRKGSSRAREISGIFKRILPSGGASVYHQELAVNTLLKEIEWLQHVPEPLAEESVSVAKDKIEEIKAMSLPEINYFLRNGSESLFWLPYMGGEPLSIEKPRLFAAQSRSARLERLARSL